MVTAAGTRRIAEKPAVHRYSLAQARFPRLGEAAAAIGVSVTWLERLVALTSAWSNLYVYERAATGSAS